MIMQLEHISKSFGGRQLFHDVTFRLEEYERLALVGPNGAGKTTMLNIISGAEDADEGRVLFAKGARVGYLEQEAIEMADQPIFEEVMSSQVEVLEAERRLYKLEQELGEDPTEQQLEAAGRARDAYEVLGGYTIEAKVRSVMFGLGFAEGDLRRLTTEFSGGWQMRIALAKLLIRNPEVLLLDEPTNHLDLESVKWLEGFLRGYAGTVVVVSHDRAFMDNMVDRVAEVDNGQVNLYKGNYSDYLRIREERLERLRAEAAKQAEEIAHMEAFVEKFRYKPTSAILSPRYMVKSKPSYTVLSPKRFTRPRARTTSSPVRGGCLKLKCTVFFSSGSSMRLIFSSFFTRSCTCLAFVGL